MRVTVKQRYPIQMRYLDSGNTSNFTSPYTNPAPASPPGAASGPSKSNVFSPAVVAVIGVLAGAFLIISYYRIFLRYCNSHHFTVWGTRSDGRNGGPSTIVLMEEHAWPADASGLDEVLISRIPTCKYSADEGIVEGTECSVCLGEFEEGEELRILPKCNHPFHIPCIDTWLAMSSTCPLCRVNIVLAAAVPYALLPVEREPPASARGPTMSFIPAANANPMQALINHEIEILQEQHVQEFLEAGQLSGPASSPSLPSSRGSLLTPPDAGTSDNHQTEMQGGSIVQHMRHLSPEGISPSSTREIHVINDPNSQPTERPISQLQQQQQQLNDQVAPSLPKPRFYSRARSSGNRPAKHPLLPVSTAQTKCLAKKLGGSSGTSRSTGSRSMNQMVVELQAQEIFRSNVGRKQGDTGTDIVETRVCRGKSPREAPTNGSSRRAGNGMIHHHKASFELMWSIDEQANRLMWSADARGDAPAGSSRQASRGDNIHRDYSSSGDEMAEMTLRLADAMQLGSNPGSDDDDVAIAPCQKGSCKSFQGMRMMRSNSSGSIGTWPSKRHSFTHSMARLTRYGSGGFKQNSLQRSEKVHASDPVFEMFEVD